MVNANEWFNQNYPAKGICQRVDDRENYGKRREEIINLDISNQNLEGYIGGPDGGILGDINKLEVIDYSHNPRLVGFGLFRPFPQLRKINISHSNIVKVVMAAVPRLSHFDVSGNSLATLDLRGLSGSLEVLKCSDNPLIPLVLVISTSQILPLQLLPFQLWKRYLSIIPMIRIQLWDLLFL
ncbi:13924_t:CDS:2 [Funneliformis caledonium]|uniref:13924_t:CDS:1 n=1 Tax=Funneliformis caledonium TaxID=1117310 RepID=A0A9N9HM68_9GLOM|nr:13924_t:CDS:2 [Funneliformis caledonium]